MGRPAISVSLSFLLLAAACDAAEEVAVQPLPPLERPSAEARMGLPELVGAWRFAGWELAAGDSANLASPPPGFGQLLLQAQRLDSIGGFYASGGARLPLVGEVRRDSVVALVAFAAPGDARYIAGRVERDTLWVRLTSLAEAGAWPADARAAFVRGSVAAPFVRLAGAPPPPSPVDTTALPPGAGVAGADSLPAAGVPPGAPTGQPAGPPAGGQPTLAPRPPVAGQPQPQPQRPPAQVQPLPRPPVQARPEAEPGPAQPAPQPAPQPEPEPVAPPREEPAEEPPPPPPVRLLGEPVGPDTTAVP